MYEDGICKIVDGLYSKTLKFDDINYQIARREEQINVFKKYCSFLNYFEPEVLFQITIINRTIDKEELKKVTQMELDGSSYDEYRIEQNKIISEQASQGLNDIRREKYLTFSVFENSYEAAKRNLIRIETDVLNNFKMIDCMARTLSGTERLELIHDIFNQGKERFEFDYDYLLDTDLHTKDFVSPDYFDFSEKNTYEFDDKFGQVMYLMKLPTGLQDDLLAKLSDLPINMKINLHINSVDQGEALDLVKSKIAFMEQQKIDEQKKAIKDGYDVELISHELKYAYNEAVELLDDLQNKDQRMFKVTMLIDTQAETEEELEVNVSKIKGLIRTYNCKVGDLNYLQEQAMNSSLPLGLNHIEIQRTLTTSSTAIFVPFTTVELFESNGMHYGLNALSRNLIYFNRKSLKNANGFILGTSGSGKSFAAKREMINVLLSTEDELLIIDPEKEYLELANGFGGEIIEISAKSKNNINPLDITMDYADKEDPLGLKSEFIMTIFEVLFGGKYGLSGVERSIINRASIMAYQPFFKNPSKNPMPTLKDLYNIIKGQIEPEAQKLALELELYTTGTLSIFANATNVNISNRMVVYNVSELGKQLRTFGMLIVLDQIWNRITQNRALGKRTWIYIDEIQHLFNHEDSANYFFELWSRARKWGAIPTGITQNVETLLLSDYSRRMLANSEFIMMLDQKASDREELAELLDISEQQLGYVTNSPIGQGLIFCGTSIIPFMDKISEDNKLYKMITTKPGEM